MRPSAEPAYRAPDRRLRILHLLPRLVTGGAETQAVRLAAGLRARGHDARIGVLSAGGDLEPLADRLGVPVARFPRAWRADPVPVARIAAYCHARGVDVLHTWLFFDSLYGRLASLFCGPRVAVVSQAVGVEYAERSARLAAERLLAYRSRVLVANSEWMAARLRRLRFPAGRIRVVPNGVDLAWVRTPVAALPKPGARARVVGAVGRLVPFKDHATFLRAGARVLRMRRNVYFIIAGDGPERGALEGEAARLGLRERLALPGNVADIRPVLRTLDVFVLSSRTLPDAAESSPNALMEAMALGLPCVATRVCGVPEVIENGVNGLLVEPGDAEGMADAILRLLRDGRLRRRLGAAAARTIEERFPLERALDRFEALYRCVLAGR